MMERQKLLPENDLLKLKVCGLTQLEQIEKLTVMKTDFLGFIFYEKSPRYILNHLNLKQIGEIKHRGKAGVFVNESLERIAETAEKAKLNFIQLHGDESKDFTIELRKKIHPETGIIKVIRIGNQISDELQQIINANFSTVDYFLFDTDSRTFGGTGKTFDWNLLNEIEIPLPYFLSGGISLENIDKLKILKQNPLALYINSRFEKEPGIKDLEKIKFLKNNIK
ncbi:phosphoribosylanthranilate isomerase [Chryseobacterium profundimaris]|uniref:N-(5'-phosphoribosyl)anthranilate isomerase n=1 Tax=Chryseobacterium profundimaris TaxID=1387275 RepID=A0ABY1P0S7_9FLAO|nr:phosphoribosylanthranilate isomerase [Chryseobacterium profundimaris]SMP23256.1 phosphoribosylanthranilate isomerase [Chryseobacterium profundimaris]